FASGAGPARYLVGLALGCAITKSITEAVMARGYARTARRLERKLGAHGALTGFAPGEGSRVFGGYRFRDIGLLKFEEGRLCYRSERTTIELAAQDIIEVRLVPAAPAAWFNLQPMIRFRDPEPDAVRAFVLHPLHFWSTGKPLFRQIERWLAEA